MKIRKVVTFVEEIRLEEGREDGAALTKAAVAAVISNPYAMAGYSEDLSRLVEPSAELGRVLGKRLAAALGGAVESHGKAAIVGTAGAHEHAVAAETSVAGDAFREATGGTAWLPSVTKRCVAGTPVDVPLCFNRDLWVASHYDAITVAVHDAPLPSEIVVIFAGASRGRLNARLGGLTAAEASRDQDAAARAASKASATPSTRPSAPPGPAS
jgi:Amino acid synthesis